MLEKLINTVSKLESSNTKLEAGQFEVKACLLEKIDQTNASIAEAKSSLTERINQSKTELTNKLVDTKLQLELGLTEVEFSCNNLSKKK